MTEIKTKTHASHVLIAHAQLVLTSLPTHVTASSHRLWHCVRKQKSCSIQLLTEIRAGFVVLHVGDVTTSTNKEQVCRIGNA
jgi:hypothetical protein